MASTAAGEPPPPLDNPAPAAMAGEDEDDAAALEVVKRGRGRPRGSSKGTGRVKPEAARGSGALKLSSSTTYKVRQQYARALPSQLRGVRQQYTRALASLVPEAALQQRWPRLAGASEMALRALYEDAFSPHTIVNGFQTRGANYFLGAAVASRQRQFRAALRGALEAMLQAGPRRFSADRVRMFIRKAEPFVVPGRYGARADTVARASAAGGGGGGGGGATAALAAWRAELAGLALGKGDYRDAADALQGLLGLSGRMERCAPLAHQVGCAYQFLFMEALRQQHAQQQQRQRRQRQRMDVDGLDGDGDGGDAAGVQPFRHQSELWRGTEAGAAWGDANRFFRKALALSPANAHVALQLAQLQCARGRPQGALQRAQELRAAAPCDSDAHWMYATMAQANGAADADVAAALLDVLRCDGSQLGALQALRQMHARGALPCRRMVEALLLHLDSCVSPSAVVEFGTTGSVEIASPSDAEGGVDEGGGDDDGDNASGDPWVQLAALVMASARAALANAGSRDGDDGGGGGPQQQQQRRRRRQQGRQGVSGSDSGSDSSGSSSDDEEEDGGGGRDGGRAAGSGAGDVSGDWGEVSQLLGERAGWWCHLHFGEAALPLAGNLAASHPLMRSYVRRGAVARFLTGPGAPFVQALMPLLSGLAADPRDGHTYVSLVRELEGARDAAAALGMPPNGDDDGNDGGNGDASR